MNKINAYIFMQILKSCTLIFFIFVSIAWLLQITRLFNILNNMQIDIFTIVNLSFLMIPNLIIVVLPFIILFGLVIAFVKLDKDNEIIAIFSSGLSINEVSKPFYFSAIIFILFFLLLNLFLSPIIYEKFKYNEFKLRNSIDLNNINIVNFIKLDEKLVLDFNKKNGEFTNVFIKFLSDKENIIYAENANIIKDENEIIFNLSEGFKLSFNKANDQIEKLEFQNYKMNFPITQNNNYSNYDKNSQTIFQLINDNKYKEIFEKIFDVLIILFIYLFFFYNNILKHKYNIINLLFFIGLTILIVIINNLFKNIDLNAYNFVLFNTILLIFLISSVIYSRKSYK